MWNPHSVGRRPKEQNVRDRLPRVTSMSQERSCSWTAVSHKSRRSPPLAFGTALASSAEETPRDLARMETMMQEGEHHGDRWFKEAVQQAKVAETIQAMKAETRAQGTPLGGTGRFTHGALAPDDEGELRYAVTASGGKVILAFGTPVEWIGMTPRIAHRLADALNKWASET